MGFASQANIHTLFALKSTTEASIAALKRENEQLPTAANELGHRLKNLVAVIQSIARQTIRQSTTMDDFEVRFAGRLGAFGRSLDLLVANEWHGARLDEVVRLELAIFDSLDGVRISVKGPPLHLKPEAARSISLALHELATNASKYGALSVPDGMVAVHWQLVSSGTRRRLRMTWQESGGPVVTEPTRWGFGRQVIQQIPAHALAGNVTHEFLPHGVRWSLDIPATFLVDAQSSFANVRPYMRSRRKEVDQLVSQ
jgi:two-component sensor histidine kinase